MQLPLYIYLIAYTLGKCIYLGLLPGHEFATSAEGGSCFCLVFGRRATKNSGDFPPGRGENRGNATGKGEVYVEWLELKPQLPVDSSLKYIV